LAIEVGSWWHIWGERRQVLTRQTRPELSGRVYTLKCPEGEYPMYVKLSPRASRGGKYSWSDWVLESALERQGMPLLDEHDPEAPPEAPPLTSAEVIEKVAEEARAQKVSGVTPKKRLQNRVTSTRYKIRNPQKHGREEWTPQEITEMEAHITKTKEEISAL
jgi:hypothetical protein